METAILMRDEVTKSVIRGTLRVKGKVFQVLERPWLNNKANESCIPAGEYNTIFLKQSASGKYKDVYQVQAVPGRSGVLIHSGNVVEHTRGCLIMGLQRAYLAGKPAVTNSRTALHDFVALLEHKPFVLHIIGNQQSTINN
jgi:hypothetical protein